MGSKHSTTELRPQDNGNVAQMLERAAGIEPAWPAWKAGTLPLSYARLGEYYTEIGCDVQSGKFDDHSFKGATD